MLGDGIKESLQRTLGDHLEATDGKYATSKHPDWIKATALQLIGHNNKAEEPFAFAKFLKKFFPSLKLQTLAGLTLSKMNGTFARAQSPAKTKKGGESRTPRPAGAAVVAPPALLEAVRVLTSTGKSKASKRDSLIPALRLRASSDIDASRKLQVKKKQDEIDQRQAKKARDAEGRNVASEVELVVSVDALAQLLSSKRSDSARVHYLLEQVAARVKGRNFSYLDKETRFLTTHLKIPTLKTTAEEPGVGNHLKYMHELVGAAIVYDATRGRYAPAALAVASAQAPTVARQLPVIDKRFLCSTVQALFEAEKQEAASLMMQSDDSKLLEYEEKYVGKYLFDEDDGKANIVLKISVISKNKNQRTKEIWEVTCAEVDREGAVLASCKVPGTDIVLDKKLVGFGLEDSDGGRYVAIKDMMRHHAEWLLPPPQQTKKARVKSIFGFGRCPRPSAGGTGRPSRLNCGVIRLCLG